MERAAMTAGALLVASLLIITVIVAGLWWMASHDWI